MGLRIYRDPTGVEWRVWEVPPRFSPLRSERDRRSNVAPQMSNDRRQKPDRRVTVPPPEWVHGWICFQSETAKLRLCPLPEGWEQAPTERLEILRRVAVPVRTANR